MSQLHNERTEERTIGRRDDARAAPDEVPKPLPELEESTLRDPSPRDLSKRDYAAIFKRAVKASIEDHIPNIAAALAYYAFLAIPSAFLIALGVFSLVADPEAITTLVDKLGTVMPSQATDLVQSSLERMTESSSSGITALVVGGVVALWALTGAMQNIMWALNVAYDRDETRGFLRRRVVAVGMLAFAFLGFTLMVGVLILGPHLSSWLGESIGAESAVRWTWLLGQWPLLLVGLLLVFAGLMSLGPNVEHPRWSFLTFGAAVAVLIWLLASAAFAVYASRFGSYNKVWGSLSAVVVLLTWLWLSSLALLFGAEVNAEAERSRELRQGVPPERTLEAPSKA
jgi:membrane protein